jgi:hypothetical protein
VRRIRVDGAPVNAEQRHLVAACEKATRVMLSDDVTPDDAQLVTFLCSRVRTICADGNDIEELATRRFAVTAMELAAALAADRDSDPEAAAWLCSARHEWIGARGELLEIRLDAM